MRHLDKSRPTTDSLSKRIANQITANVFTTKLFQEPEMIQTKICIYNTHIIALSSKILALVESDTSGYKCKGLQSTCQLLTYFMKDKTMTGLALKTPLETPFFGNFNKYITFVDAC